MEKFNEWTVLDAPPGKFWLCRCSCGLERMTRKADVKAGRSKSCGHDRGERSGAWAKANQTIHGMEKTRTYRSWVAMRQRCKNPNTRDYPRYGGRGITVCPGWESFLQFFKDMGERPEGMTLDRINNNLGYAPDNCRWATLKQQGRNTRSNKTVVVNGETMTLIDACEKYGVDDKRVGKRLRSGWTIERAIGLTA